MQNLFLATRVLTAALCATAFAQQKPRSEVFQGRLNRTLSQPNSKASRMWSETEMLPADSQERERFGMDLSPFDSVWANQVDPWTGQSKKLRVAVVRRTSGQVFLAIDLNGNGKYSGMEIRRMQPDRTTTGTYDLGWDFPDPSRNFVAVPISFRVQTSDKQVFLRIDDRVLATGQFSFYGRSVRVAFLCFPEEPSIIDVRRNRLGVDTDGDGEVDWAVNSPENVVPSGRYSAAPSDSTAVAPVLRVGERYVSIISVDVAAKTFLVRERSRGDYVRIELTIGASLPDFQFIDFTGKARHFSEFHGKFVLLDFWGSWCGPCLRDLPKLEQLYFRLRASGLEILGIDNDEDPKAADKVVARFRCGWTNARSDRSLFSDRFAIGSWPTKILVDPQGKILSLDREGGPSLSVDDLENTLTALPGFPVH